MSRVLVAGVDTSTQSTKVRVTDAETGEMVRFGQAKHPDGTSVNPDAWWQAFQEALDRQDWTGLERPVVALHGQPADESRSTLLWDGEWEITWVTFRDMGAAFGACAILPKWEEYIAKRESEMAQSNDFESGDGE